MHMHTSIKDLIASMSLPTTKTPPKNDPGQFTALLYGATKIGKSSMCSHFPNALFFPTEPGLNSLEVYQAPVKDWPEFLTHCADLAKTKHPFKTVVIDTVDNLYKYCSEYMCKKLNITHESEMGFGKAYQMVNNEFQRVITRLSMLPVGLIMISHAVEKEIDTRTGKVKKNVPTLSEGARKIICGLVDLILYCDTVVEKDEKTGKPIGHKRVIRTKAHQFYDAGDRTGRLPDTLPLDYKAFIEAFTDAKSGKSPIVEEDSKKEDEVF